MKSISAIPRSRAQQRGVSLLTAVFLITALAVLGALMTRLVIVSSQETVDEWYSAQALYAAESGVDWAAYDLVNGGAGTAADVTANGGGTAWFTTTVDRIDVGGKTLYTITSIGRAGGSLATVRARREVEVQFMP